MFALCHDLQVGRPVVPLVAVEVVDDLTLLQPTSDLLLGNDPVFMATMRFYVQIPRPCPPKNVPSHPRRRNRYPFLATHDPTIQSAPG